MKYFVDIKNWDEKGYTKELEKLLPRFDAETVVHLKNNTLVNGKVVSIKVINKANGKRKNPTSIKMVIEQRERNEGIYEIKWSNVRKFFMDYDITKNVFENKPSKIHLGGRNGIDDWGCDEITPLESTMSLQHEILLYSQTKIIIHFSNIRIRKLKE